MLQPRSRTKDLYAAYSFVSAGHLSNRYHRYLTEHDPQPYISRAALGRIPLPFKLW